jgi:hypothetical protein
MPKFDVFLSHNSVDKPWAIKLKDHLQRYGILVWLDKDEIRPGDLFAKALEEGLANSRAVALIVSPDAMVSGWVSEEYYSALSLAKAKQSPLHLIPVMLRDAELPGFLAGRNWVDFREESTYSQNVWKLVWGITGNKPAEVLDLGAPDAPPSAPDPSATKPAAPIQKTKEPSSPTQEPEEANNDKDESQPNDEITDENGTAGGGDQGQTVSPSPEDEPNEPPEPSPPPIGTRIDVLIDESWLKSTSENDQGKCLEVNLCVYPAVPGRPQKLRTFMSKREFTVNIQANCIILEEERRGRIQSHEPVEFSDSNTAEIEDDVKWIFTRYISSDQVCFDDHTLRDIVISFDPKIVKEAVLIKRERIGSQQKYRDDYYLLVFEGK